MPINRHFDLIAPLYDRVICRRRNAREGGPATQNLSPYEQAQLARLRGLLLPDLPEDHSGPTPGWMLDAAGGTGRLAEHFAPLVERLVVCDLSMPMLRRAEGRGGERARSHVERLPFPNGIFTRILVVDAFHHFGRQPAVLGELARVLAPGGRLVIEEPDIRSGWVKLIALGEALLLMGSRFRAPAWISEQMERVGLQPQVVTDNATAWIVGVK